MAASCGPQAAVGQVRMMTLPAMDRGPWKTVPVKKFGLHGAHFADEEMGPRYSLPKVSEYMAALELSLGCPCQ